METGWVSLTADSALLLQLGHLLARKRFFVGQDHAARALRSRVEPFSLVNPASRFQGPHLCRLTPLDAPETRAEVARWLERKIHVYFRKTLSFKHSPAN